MANNYTKDTHSYGKERIYDWMLDHTIKRNKEHNKKTSFFTLSIGMIDQEKKMLPYCDHIESWNKDKREALKNRKLVRDINVIGFSRNFTDGFRANYHNTKDKHSLYVTAEVGDLNDKRHFKPEGLTTFFYDYCGLNKSLEGFKVACLNQKSMKLQGGIPAFYVTFAINGRSKGGSPKMVEESRKNFGIEKTDNNNTALPKVFEKVKRIGEIYSDAKATDAAYYHNNKSIVLTVLFEYKKYARSIKFKNIKNFTDPNRLSVKKTNSSKNTKSIELTEKKRVVFALLYDIAKESGISATEMSKAFRNPQSIAHHSPGFRKKLNHLEYIKFSLHDSKNSSKIPS